MLRKLASAILALLLTGTVVTPASAANPALVPAFGTVESVAGGFAVPITNWDANFVYTAIGSDCAVATVADGWLTVTGVLANQSASARVFTNQVGYDEGVAVATGTAAGYRVPSFLSPENTSGWLAAAKPDSQGRMFTIRDEALIGQVAVEVTSDQGNVWTTVKTWATTASAKRPDLETGPGGLVGTVWLSPGASSGTVVKASISQNSGATWTDYVVSAPESIDEPKVSFTSNGTAVALWRQNDAGVEKVFSSHLLTGQSTWSAPVVVSNPTDSFYGINMAKTSDGHVMAIWGRSQGVSAAKFDKDTGLWSASVETAAQYNETASMRIDADESGRIWAMWFTGASRHVGVANFDGTAWNVVGPATTFTSFYGSPAIVATANEVVVAWVLNGSSLGYRRYNLATSSWGTSSTIFTGGQTMQNLWLNQGSGSDLYLSFLKQSANASYYLPFYAKSSNGGTSWATPVHVAPSSRNNYWPRTATDSTGAVYVFWQDQADYGGQQRQRPMVTTIASTVSSLDPRTIYQVAEINAGAAHSHAYDMEVLNNKMYIITQHASTGYELFEFDGTTVDLVEDLWPGTGSGAYDTEFVANTGSALYFQGTNGITGYELYKFDGTTVSLAADINPATTTASDVTGNLVSAASRPRDGVVLANKLFFTADYPSAATGYVLDLTSPNATPQRLTTYFSGFSASGFSSPLVLNNVLYFKAGGAVYKTDGSATPTEVPGTSGLYVFSLGAHGNKLLLGAGTSQEVELMIWDPASPATPAALLSNINTYNTGSNFGSYPVSFVSRCNTTYFVASSGFDEVVANREVWKYDGYEVTLAKDFWPGSAASDNGWPQGLHAAGNEVFTFAQSPGAGFEPWILKGSEFNMIQDFTPGSQGSMSGAPPFETWNGTTYFSLWGPTGLELYAYGVRPQNQQVAAFAVTYTITYDSNGGAGTTTATNPAGQVALHSGTGFSMAGKVLQGWDSSSAATTPTYLPGANYALAGNVTLYAIWGDAPSQSSATPTISIPGGRATGTSGGDLELTGTNLNSIVSAQVHTKDADIKEKSETRIKLGLPELDPGIYDLTLTSASGRLTLQGAVRVTYSLFGITPEAQAKIKAWTKQNETGNKVSMIAKNPVGVGKVQFLHNGKEIAWLKAVDASDPKLNSKGGANYLLRTVELVAGKNTFEIYVEGKRVRRASYSH